VRSLSPEEAELWSKVAGTIQPLSRENKRKQSPEIERQSTARRSPVQKIDPLPIANNVRAQLGETLDGSWDRRLRSGDLEPDRVIDLHGMNLDTAWRAIDRGLQQAIATGERVMLLITGHHRVGDRPVERGRIRAAVYDWLAASRHASRIAAVRGAHRRHGGGGSLYVVLRRR
jgi:DNA-nicking Smr family endonuclease